ncbi:metalloprotease family M76 [Thraustotheca clavata]|uniref:Mitochondrial inner membrane protease ATP23 n=1 Tax=Thraustotheca clavata TaxID=74557 RepID=A0A1W0ACM2_9STRA|nr:metalloprotease family M76 [Thraustotheca clavata]
MQIEECYDALQEALKASRPKKLVTAINEHLEKTNATPKKLELNDAELHGLIGVEGKARAFFAAPPAIVLCANRLRTQEDVDEVIVHELIHAYDYTVRNMDLTKPDILACSEVRSARESECYQKVDHFCKTNSTISAFQKGCEWWTHKCVKDNAIQATSSMLSPEEAKAQVNNVFPKCYVDHAPFQ